MLEENSIIDRSWSSTKWFIMLKYTDNANGDLPITVENAWYFKFFWVQGVHMFIWEEK